MRISMDEWKEQTKIDSKYLPPQFALVARICVGGYLLYTAYSLIDSVINGEGISRYWMGIAMVVFTIVGILLIFFSGRDMLRGKYVGGAMDAGTEEEEGAERVSAKETAREALMADGMEHEVTEAAAGNADMAGEMAGLEKNDAPLETEELEGEQ